MVKSRKARVPLALLAFTGILSAQLPAKVDFAKDVLPLFRQNCVGCHGPRCNRPACGSTARVPR